MKSEQEIREAYNEFSEKHKGNFLQHAEVEAVKNVFKWILEEV